MTPVRREALRRIGTAAALAAVIATASLILRTAPTESEWQAPIEVHGRIGEEVRGRNVAVTVEDVRAARSVTASNGWVGETTGAWVVVDVTAEAVVTEYAAGLRTAELVLGEDVYSASARPGLATIADRPLSVGIPVHGPLMFEVPRDAVPAAGAADAVVRLAATDDARTDSLLVIPVDLSRLSVADAVTTDEPVEGRR
ncbi:hypothetical protein C5E16_11825 [Clavibacter michiganensis]|uniref:DUF4352 domain-containing protein n=1 Tax=Clavibacter michiganensis TaxID=28447 RepID=A0A2S5VRW9_9MICO|nr:hypothetical protein [Clavibacter michiganensis]PPF66329.1 hypothetical protein C5E16_11825 [Clavibacter michiganensis]